MLPVLFHLFRHAFARTAEMNVSFTTKTAFNQIRWENPGGDALNKLKTRRIGYRNQSYGLEKVVTYGENWRWGLDETLRVHNISFLNVFIYIYCFSFVLKAHLQMQKVLKQKWLF